MIDEDTSKKCYPSKSSSPVHSSLKDILIVNGTIGEIGEGIKPDHNTKIIAHENLHVSNGWTDCGVSFGEPGYEERETIGHGLEVAAKSGFTKILLNANTDPLPDSSSNIGHLIKMGQGHTTSLFPIGTLSVGSKGKQMASFDMHTQGAIAFGDHKNLLIEVPFKNCFTVLSKFWRYCFFLTPSTVRLLGMG